MTTPLSPRRARQNRHELVAVVRRGMRCAGRGTYPLAARSYLEWCGPSLVPDIVPTPHTDSLDTYAHWQALSRQALEDIPMVQSVVTNALQGGVLAALEAAAAAALAAAGLHGDDQSRFCSQVFALPLAMCRAVVTPIQMPCSSTRPISRTWIWPLWRPPSTVRLARAVCGACRPLRSAPFHPARHTLAISRRRQRCLRATKYRHT